MTWCWLALQTGVDAGAVAWCRRRRRAGPVIGLFALTSFVAICLAFILGEDAFGKMRLAAWAVYVHGPIGLSFGVWALWPAHRRWAITGLTTALAIVAVGIEAFVVEPHWLEVSHHTITSAKVTQRLRIVVLADVQTDHVGEWERRVFARAAALKPDLILWPGDYLQCHRSEALAAEVPVWREAVQSTPWTPRLGAFAVTGDVDHKADWPRMFDGTGVECLPVTMRVTTGGITISALSLRDSRNPATRVDGTGVEGFHIAVGHAPDFALGECAADLLLAGHTHGGQVQLPLLGPIVTLTRAPRAWAGGGLVTLPGGRHLIVSRGIGMERHYAPRLRFGCRPELVVIDVVPATE